MRLVTGKRRGGVVTGTLAAALLVLTAVGVATKISSSRIEREALDRVREVAEDSRYRGTRAQAHAIEDLPGEERAFRLAEGERALEMIGEAVGGRTGDLISFVNMADESIREYFEERYRRQPSVIEMERLEATMQGMTRYIQQRQVPRALTDNSALVIEMVRHHDEASAFLDREENREWARDQNPELRGLDDEELLVKWLEPRIAAEVERAADGYQRIERVLAEAGVEVTPESVNAILSTAIRDARVSGDFTSALAAALHAATNLLALDGHYSGTISGDASGGCTVEISGTSVSIRLSGQGSNREGQFSASVRGHGRIDRDTGAITGSSLDGEVLNRWGAHEVSGTFSGSAGSNRVSGEWSASSRGIGAGGTFEATK